MCVHTYQTPCFSWAIPGKYKQNQAEREQLRLSFFCIVKRLKDRSNFIFYVLFVKFFTSLKLVKHMAEMSVKCTGKTKDITGPKGVPQWAWYWWKRRKMVSETTGSISRIKHLYDSRNTTALWPLDQMPLAFGPKNVAWYSRENKTQIAVRQPRRFAIYDANMGEVDSMDQNTSGYWTSIHRQKWYSSFLTYFANIAKSNNTIQLWKKDEAAMGFLGFRRTVANVHLEKRMPKPSYGRSQAQSKLQECYFHRINHLVLQQVKYIVGSL